MPIEARLSVDRGTGADFKARFVTYAGYKRKWINFNLQAEVSAKFSSDLLHSFFDSRPTVLLQDRQGNYAAVLS